jgi:multiple antibiotic resistance protein
VNTSLATSLLVLLNPFVIALIYISYRPRVRVREALRDGISVCLASTSIMSIIILSGTRLLDWVGVSLPAIRVAGGLILMLSIYSLMNTAEVSPRDDNFSLASPFVTPICVGGASIALLFQYIAPVPVLTLAVFVSLFSAVFFCFLVIGLSLPMMVLFSRFIPEGVRSGVKSISLFFVFAIGVDLLGGGLADLYLARFGS